MFGPHPDKFYIWASQEKTHLLRPEFFLASEPTWLSEICSELPHHGFGRWAKPTAAGWCGSDAVHQKLARRIQYCDRDRFLVNIHPDILRVIPKKGCSVLESLRRTLKAYSTRGTLLYCVLSSESGRSHGPGFAKSVIRPMGDASLRYIVF
jgi:hypothetical protein